VAARDVVVVGSGHNALVAACYLARAGLDVEVVERDTVLGGAVSTVERWPGYAVDRGSSAHIMVPAHRHRGGPAAGRVRPHLPGHGPVGLRAVRRPGHGEQQALTFHVSLDATVRLDRGAVR
jgi:glycine/D-amino acid oxidase-like deaminating enzyme